MTEFVLRRIASGIAVMLLVVVFLAVVPRFVSGDPARVILGPRATPALVAQVREELHLNDSIPRQVWDFLDGAAHGDLGVDTSNEEPVTTLLRESGGDTLILALSSLLIATVIGIPIGVLAAARVGSTIDGLTGAVGVGLIAVPAFVVALLLIVVLAIRLAWLPGVGSGSLTANPVDYGVRLILPAIALAVGWVGYLARLVRSSMLEELESEYVRNARSFGIPERSILYRYALRNAMVPVIAVCGSALGYLAAGTIVIEGIFNRPGVGNLLVVAVETREWAVVRGCALIFALLFVLGNTLAEIAVRAIDPRVELGRRST